MELKEFREKYYYYQSTAMMQQYLDVKFEHINCLLLFRMGDFYELFFDDAIIASKILGITLTKRGKVGDEEVPMCGVPYHALEGYLHKLLDAQCKVAICEQLETPEEARKRGGYKAVVKREVSRIITPGTIIEESLAAANTPNYLASMVLDKNYAAVAYVDLAVAEIFTVSLPRSEIINELSKTLPRELLISENLRGYEMIDLISKQFRAQITYQVDSFFAANKCKKIILDRYRIASISAIGEISELEISAVGSIIEYLLLTQKHNMPELPLPKIINYYNFMIIDAATRKNLEITQNIHGNSKNTLFDVIDHNITKAGSRLLNKFLSNPLANLHDIKQRLLVTDFFYSRLDLTFKIREILKKTGDLHRYVTKISMNRSVPRDLLLIKDTLDSAIAIKQLFLQHCGINLPGYIEEIIDSLSGDEELVNLIHESIRLDCPNNLNEGGFIKHSFHPKVQELHEVLSNGQNYVDKLRIKYQQQTGIDTLKISHNNVLGLFIEITSRNANKMVGDHFIHRQSTLNSVRYSTAELQNLERDIVNAKTLVISLENEIYTQICQEILQKVALLKSLANNLSLLDVFCNFAYIADQYNYIKPELSDNLDFVIAGGRHPVVEHSKMKYSQAFVRNNCLLSEDSRIWLITGPNMSGKSTFLRQNAIIAILAQIGSFVPAEQARIGVIDKLFSRIGSGDDLSKGQSTFMIEMLEISAILAQSSANSFIILDEVGRGTSTYDGVAIAWSVLEYIASKLKARCLFATHYHELTKVAESLDGVENYTVAIEEFKDEILFLHQIIQGAADKSYGVHVAKLAGLPQTVIKRANDILTQLETSKAQKEEEIIDNLAQMLDMDEADSADKADNLIIQIIADLNPDHLSPKDALELIYRLKAELADLSIKIK